MLRVFLSSPGIRKGLSGIMSTALCRGKVESSYRLGTLLPLSQFLRRGGGSSPLPFFSSSSLPAALVGSRCWNSSSSYSSEEGEMEVEDAHRHASSNGALRSNNNNRSPNRNVGTRRSGGGNSPNTTAVLPPAFDVVHWNDEDVQKGHLLRVIYRDNYVVLDYYQQSQVIMVPAGERPPPRSARAERTVTVALPPSFVARLLSVLEEKSTVENIQLRATTAVFEAAPEKGAHFHILKCSTLRPSSLGAAAVDGQKKQDGSSRSEEEQREEGSSSSSAAPEGKGRNNMYEWEVIFDPAESLMLHRFLTQCLQYNTGFCRPFLSSA